MPWCPNCKTEYNYNIKVCSDCGSMLVSELPKTRENSYYIDGDSEAFLIKMNDGVEADMMEESLKAAGIPVLKKRPGAGEYIKIYTGRSYYGVEFYVPSKTLNKAREIVNSFTVRGEFVDFPKQEFDDKNLESEISVKKWFILLGLAVILIIAINFLINLING